MHSPQLIQTFQSDEEDTSLSSAQKLSTETKLLMNVE